MAPQHVRGAKRNRIDRPSAHGLFHRSFRPPSQRLTETRARAYLARARARASQTRTRTPAAAAAAAAAAAVVVVVTLAGQRLARPT